MLVTGILGEGASLTFASVAGACLSGAPTEPSNIKLPNAVDKRCSLFVPAVSDDDEKQVLKCRRQLCPFTAAELNQLRQK